MRADKPRKILNREPNRRFQNQQKNGKLGILLRTNGIPWATTPMLSSIGVRQTRTPPRSCVRICFIFTTLILFFRVSWPIDWLKNSMPRPTSAILSGRSLLRNAGNGYYGLSRNKLMSVPMEQPPRLHQPRPSPLHKLLDPAPETPSPPRTMFSLALHRANTTTFPSPNAHGSALWRWRKNFRMTLRS